MSEEKNLGGNRRERKNNMRKNVLPEMSVEDIEDLDRTIRRQRLNRMKVIGIIVLILIAAALIYKVVRGLHPYSKYSVMWENEDLGSSSASYAELNGNVLRITMDGASCLDTSGNVLWNYGYNMRNPRVEIRGNYGVIADIQNKNAIIFDNTGVLGTITTIKSILNASISEHGVTALVLDDTSANYITFYDSQGNALDIEIKTLLSGDGYPMDISLSPEGTGLVSSVVFLDQNQMQNQITFYNFDVGQNESNRVVGYFNCGDIMYPQVSYMSDTVVCAFGDSQIDLYSLKNESQPELITSITFDHNIYSVFCSESQIGVITQTDEVNRMLQVYDTSGNKTFEKEVDFDYSHAEFSNGYVVLYNSTECQIISGRGNERYQGTLDGSIQGITVLSDDTCLVMGGSSMEKIRFR